MSQTIPDSVLVCACGARALVLSAGGVCVCAECARAFRFSLTPIAWSEVERVLSRSERALSDFEWLRARVPHGRRRTLRDLSAASRSFSARVTPWVTVVVVAALLALIVSKAVAS